ncbi:Uma2 family endonuclease [Paludisphaera rhizosphaerae]|uniref:Uma2 family endonuclease n=1 Tax=Paludisphaera rhizosphaerae TaxID=2711216 RepID=UPI001980540B|nr:Uma2 family endonuclease [Paludisphaera rhizosphaerae]
MDVHLAVDADDFVNLCAANKDARLELTADGGLIVMAPASPDGSGRNAELTIQLGIWNKAKRLGKVFDSSSGYTLPDGSIRSPDASWIRSDRWAAVDRAERRRFTHIVPDFVAEVRSPSDGINDVRAKMSEYIAQGVRLGWLIDPETRTVEIYRPDREAEILASPEKISGEDVLPDFILDLAEILAD